MVTINRHNYEEFFLLYSDGELSEAERQSVDIFIDQNPDLKQELDILLQSKLDVDEHVVLEDKTALYKSVSTVHLGNYEEQFLLLLDDELSETGKKDLAQFIQRNPELQNSFIVLQSLQLPKEHIVFADKQSLYKKDKKPVIWLQWRKLAVAAAIMGIALLVWNITPSRKSVPEFALKQEIKKETVPPQHIIKTEIENTVIPEKNNIASAEKTIQPKAKNSFATIKETVQPKEIILPSNKEQKDVLAQNAVVKNNADAIKPANNNQEPVIYKTLAGTDDAEPKNVFKQTVYKELNTDAENEKSSVYVGSVEVNKDKLRGLFKKAKGLFNKAKNDDDNVAIANFAVAKSLK